MSFKLSFSGRNSVARRKVPCSARSGRVLRLEPLEGRLMLAGDAPTELFGEGGTASCSSTDFGEIDLGDPDVADNMTHLQVGDGDTTNISVGGRIARRTVDPNEDFYFYFAVADSFVFQGDQPELSITVDYFDSGTGTLALQYDSDTGYTLPAFYKHGGSITLTGTNTWKQHTFQLNDAYFGNRQNQDADFRIFGGVGNTFYLDRLQVTPSQTIPPINVSGEIQIPKQSDWTLQGTALTGGAPGSWDVRFHGQISPSSVIKKDGVYYLYYVGADGDRSTDGGPSHRSLGVATSTDGINFTKHSGNPVITHLPHNNQEEGIFSAGTSLAANGDIVLVYGAIWAANSTTESVQSHVALATSSDGLNFTDQGYVLSWNDNNVWGYGDELFGVGTFYGNGNWHAYYIAKGSQGSWKLAIGIGPDLDNLTTTSGVITSGDFVIGGGDPVFLSDDKIALFNVRQSDKAYIEVRTADISSPGQLSAPVQSYDTFPYAHATVFLDEEADTWFLYQATDRQEDGNEIIVSTAPVFYHASSQITLFEFECDPEGWTLETWKSGPYSPGTVAWEASGGNPAGTIRSTGRGSSNNQDSNTREGSIITRNISTQGATDIQIEYDVKVALHSPPGSSGAGGNGNLLEDSLEDKLVVYYSTSGTNGPWTVAQVLSEGEDLPSLWLGQSINLIGASGVDDNANFALRFQWQFNTATDTGWIDNVRVSQASLLGDIDRNGVIDAEDIDLLYDQISGSGPVDPRSDLVPDGTIDQQDVDWLVHDIMGREYGDTNLDGRIDLSDYNTLAGHFDPLGINPDLGWSEGDFDGDGKIDLFDYVTLTLNFSPNGNASTGIARNKTSNTQTPKSEPDQYSSTAFPNDVQKTGSDLLESPSSRIALSPDSDSREARQALASPRQAAELAALDGVFARSSSTRRLSGARSAKVTGPLNSEEI